MNLGSAGLIARATGAHPVLLMAHSLGHGGGERQLALTALSLDRTRFEPHVASSQGGFWVAALEKAGVPLFSIRSRSLMSAAAASEALRLRRYIREHGIRIVQTFDFSMNVIGIPVARMCSGVAPLANLRCHTDLIPRRYRALNRMAHRISAGVVVNSEAMRKHLVEDCGINSQKIFTCYNGLDTTVFHPMPVRRMPGLENASVVIGTICVLRPEKNLESLLRAFAALAAARTGVRLLIVGSGPAGEGLKALAAALGIGDQCMFQPSTQHVIECLASMDVFVLPSLTEGLSNAIMEAMACGRCVIASDVGGNPELITDRETGLLFPVQDQKALIHALETAVDDVGLRESLGAAAAAQMKGSFSIARAAERMQEIYGAVLSCAS